MQRKMSFKKFNKDSRIYIMRYIFEASVIIAFLFELFIHIR